MILLLVLLLTACPVLADTLSVRVEWGYTPPTSPAVSGFQLYQEGTKSCKTMVPAATAMDCQVSINKGVTSYTLTALFNDGTESPHSAPFAFQYNGKQIRLLPVITNTPTTKTMRFVK